MMENIDETAIQIKNLMDLTDTCVYVSDFETDELLYINEPGKKVLHVNQDVYQGDTCYHYLMHRDTPCPFCHKSMISCDSFHKNLITFPSNGRQYHIRSKTIDWNGRKAHAHFISDETDLLNEQKQLRTLTDHIPAGIGIYYVYPDGRFEPNYINDGYYEMIGTTREKREKYMGFTVLDAIHPDDVVTLKVEIAQALQENRQIQHEIRVQRDDQTYIWLSIRADIVEKTKERTTLYCAYSDIDQLKKMQMNLEQKYTQMVSNMENSDEEDLIAKGRYDLTENRNLYYKRKADSSLELQVDVTFDYALEQMLKTAATKEHIELLKSRLDRQTLIEEFANGKRNGFIEYIRHDETGAHFWSLLKYFINELPDTGHLIFFVYTYDINNRVLENHMIAKLGETEYDVLGLIDVSTHLFESKSVRGIKSLADSHNHYVKGEFEKVIVGQIQETVPETEREELLQQLQLSYVEEKLKQMQTYFVSFSAYRKDGSYRRKKMNFCYLDDSRTTIFYYCNDITDLYNREQEQLRKTEDALEQAKNASESKTEFFSRMSHDMRTPMNGILGMADLSEGEEDVEVLKDNIKKIKASGEYLLGLINDTLDFQKIESGKLHLEPEAVNCSDIMKNVVDMVRPAMEKKKIHFDVQVKGVNLNCYVKVDPIRLKQIFINLISNAIKFTPEGGTITGIFECTGREGNIAHDRFVIKDTGIGMSREFLEQRIFQPFSQEHNKVTGLYAGTGLGLSIVKKLVELMGGTIEVESELGVGTAFTIVIDFEKIKDDVVEKTVDKANMKQTDLFRKLLNKKILLAEDHPLNAEIATKLLKKAGCLITWVQDGQECVEEMKKSHEGQYDVILMDVRMPVMDGLTAAKTIRESAQADAGKIPIIAMTANAYESDVQNALDAGMNAHLSKPIEPDKMYATIAQLL